MKFHSNVESLSSFVFFTFFKVFLLPSPFFTFLYSSLLYFTGLAHIYISFIAAKSENIYITV